MRTDTIVKQEGIDILIDRLGYVDTEIKEPPGSCFETKRFFFDTVDQPDLSIYLLSQSLQRMRTNLQRKMLLHSANPARQTLSSVFA